MKLASKYVAHVFISRISQYMKGKGFSEETAELMSRDASKNTDLLGKIIAEEEYGLKEEALEKPGRAGLYTGLFYIIGALLPLTPYYLFLPIFLATPTSFLIATILLGITGFIIAIVARLNIKTKVFELIVSGLGSATLTYIIELITSILFGINVG